MPLDHVVVATANFDESARTFRERFGLEAHPGGRHPGWGTANWIVPLGSAYIELVGVDDPILAATSAFGRRVVESNAGDGGPIGWCIRPNDFEATVRRLGLRTEPGSRITPDGHILEWRVAAVDMAMANPALPFFIAWDVPPDLHPGRLPGRAESLAGSRASGPGESRAEGRAEVRAVETRVRSIELRGDRPEIERWLADEDLPVVVRPGAPSVVRFELEIGDGPGRKSVVLTAG
jgi:hypothetical protein